MKFQRDDKEAEIYLHHDGWRVRVSEEVIWDDLCIQCYYPGSNNPFAIPSNWWEFLTSCVSTFCLIRDPQDKMAHLTEPDWRDPIVHDWKM